MAKIDVITLEMIEKRLVSDSTVKSTILDLEKNLITGIFTGIREVVGKKAVVISKEENTNKYEALDLNEYNVVSMFINMPNGDIKSVIFTNELTDQIQADTLLCNALDQFQKAGFVLPGGTFINLEKAEIKIESEETSNQKVHSTSYNTPSCKAGSVEEYDFGDDEGIKLGRKVIGFGTSEHKSIHTNFNNSFNHATQNNKPVALFFRRKNKLVDTTEMKKLVKQINNKKYKEPKYKHISIDKTYVKVDNFKRTWTNGYCC